MNEEQKFIEKISELKETAVMQGGFLTEEQLSESFPDISGQQKDILTSYVKENNIGIGEALPENEYLKADDEKLIKLYMDELEELDDIDASMKRVLVMNAKNGERAAKESLINSYLKAVVDTAKLYTGQGAAVADLIGEGNVAVAMAMDSLETLDDPDMLDELVMRMVMNAMEEITVLENNEAEAGRNALSLVMKVMGKAEEIHDELKRKCTIEELAEEGCFTYEEICEAIRVSANCGDYIEVPEDFE